MSTAPVFTMSRRTAGILAVTLLACGATATYVVLEMRRPSPPLSSNATTEFDARGTSAPANTAATGEVVITLPEDVVSRAGITVSTASQGTASVALRLPGAVEPNAYRQVAVTPIAGGRVTRVMTELGERVRKGQTMAEVYSPELAAAQTRLIAVKADLGASEQELRRTRQLVEIGAASQQELEQVQAAHAGRQAAAESARATLVLLGMPEPAIDRLTAGSAVSSTVRVPAPLDGIVTERSANAGLNVDPSTPLFTVVDLSTVWVVGDLLEQDLARIRIGSPASVTAPAVPGRTYDGRVTYIDPRVNAATRTARVRVEVDNPDRQLRLGMLAEIVVADTTGAAVVLVPAEAVQTIGDRHVVYVATPGEAGRYVERDVTVGAQSGENVEVIRGVQAGDMVVSTGSFYLRAERERLGLPPAGAEGPLRVTVDAQGFHPARVSLPAGKPARLTFLRTSDQTCATEVLFPDLGLRHPLPLNEAVTVALPARDGGELAFTCGMDMLKGVATFTR